MKKNYCKTIIKYDCDAYKQLTCIYFEQDPTCPTTKCKFGLYERSCTSVQATLESLHKKIKNHSFVYQKYR